MSKRRTAEEAFNVPTSVKDFIDHGVRPVNRLVPSTTVSVEREMNVDQPTSGEKVIDLDEERHAPATARRASRGRGAVDAPQASTHELSRTYAKATVQKTIRFHPRLIAELEAYTRQQELDGEKPLAIQQIQNEALDFWLEKNVRRAK
jgi:hypothetical protein